MGSLRSFSKEQQDRDKVWYSQMLKPVFADLNRSGCRYAILKGAPLSKLLYGNTGYRPSKDVDFLISKNNLKIIRNILEKNDYKPHIRSGVMTRKDKILQLNSHQDIPYEKKFEQNSKYNILVDINHTVSWSEFEGEPISADRFLDKLETILLFDVEIPILQSAESFIYLCLHHYKDMNALYTLRLKNPITTAMFEDIYRHFKILTDSDKKKILDYADSYQIKSFVYYALAYTNELFMDKELSAFSLHFKDAVGVELLGQYGLSSFERKIWKFDFLSRLDRYEVFSLIEQDLTDADKEKIESAINIL